MKRQVVLCVSFEHSIWKYFLVWLYIGMTHRSKRVALRFDLGVNCLCFLRERNGERLPLEYVLQGSNLAWSVVFSSVSAPIAGTF